MKTCLFVVVALIALSTNSAFAVVLADFESGWAGAGTLVPDPAPGSGGNTVLKLTSNKNDAGTPPDIFTIDTNGFVGKVSMDIYDFGASTWDDPAQFPFPDTPGNGGTDNGPRWGIQGDADLDGTLDNWAAAGIIQKSFFSTNRNYAYINDDISDDGQWAQTFQSDWFSPANFGNPRRVKTAPLGIQPELGNGIQKVGVGTPDSPETPGSGAWTTWEFNIAADGKVTISALEGTTGKYLDAPYETDTVTQYNGADMEIVNMKQIWITGGHDASGFDNINSLGTHGVLIDNIVFDGETSFSPADFDTDGDVDSDDLATWQAAYGSSAGGDTNNDSDSDGADFLTWQKEFTGPGVLSGAASVPEPSTALLLLSGILAMTSLATRKRT